MQGRAIYIPQTNVAVAYVCLGPSVMSQSLTYRFSSHILEFLLIAFIDKEHDLQRMQLAGINSSFLSYP
jgi:hypothetical protein